MRMMLIRGLAVFALAGTPLLAQTGGGTPGQSGGTSGPTGATQRPPTGGATDQDGSRPGPKVEDGSTTGSQPNLPIGPPGESGEPQDRRPDAKAEISTPGESNADHAFVVNAAAAGMAEVELGKLAVQKASNARVKQLGQRMVTDHGKANAELKSLAERKNMTIPADLDATHEAARDRLAKLAGDAFDRAYMQELVAGHEKGIANFRDESQGGKDAELKAWAVALLPTLEGHLKAAQDLNRSLGAVGTSGRSRR
ncbi:MAG: DUF4142 domain-containing protein [Luteitalea sp.]|nr:DUF4142 domain-containing protein [Luteitalea sp.]